LPLFRTLGTNASNNAGHVAWLVNRKDLDSVISAICDHQMAMMVDCDTPGVAKLPWLGSFSGLSGGVHGSNALERSKILVEDLNSMISRLNNNYATGAVHSYISWCV